ncbi:MAG: hypothetical protein AB7T49_15305 [Oligoflexales bacterium]
MKTIALVGIALLFAFAAAPGVFADSFEPEDVEIKLLIEDSEHPEVKKEWVKACQRLGDMMQIYSGPWGYGVFKTYSCYLKDKLVAGTPVKTVNWRVEVNALKPEIEVIVSHRTKSGRFIEEGKTWIPTHLQFLKIIQDKKVAEVLTLDIMNSLPFARVLKSSEIEKREFKLEDEIKATALVPPDSFLVFRLRYSEKYNKWIPTPVGEAKSSGPPKASKTGQTYEYFIEITEPMDLTASYWLQAKAGRGQDQDKITKVLDQNLSRYGISIFDFKDMLLDTLASGYAGIRYGVPMARGDPLIGQVPLVGILTEVRGGPLSGLRWYWDFTPKVEVLVDDQVSKLKWSRFSFGWSVGLNFEDSFVNRIDVVPKIGLIDFEGTFIAPDTGLGTLPVEFNLKNQTNLGVEGGIETAAPWFLARIWGSWDKGGILGSKGEYVTFLRGGLDTYWDLFNLGRTLECSVLVFAVAEKLTVAKEPTVLEDEETKVLGLSYNQAFLGLGLTVAW